MGGGRMPVNMGIAFLTAMSLLSWVIFGNLFRRIGLPPMPTSLIEGLIWLMTWLTLLVLLVGLPLCVIFLLKYYKELRRKEMIRDLEEHLKQKRADLKMFPQEIEEMEKELSTLRDETRPQA